MQHKKHTVILFDIDHTLFDASVYRKLMFELIAESIVIDDKERLFQKMEEVYFSHRKKIGYFDLEFMLGELQNELAMELDILGIFNTILQDETSYQQAIFDETVEVLQTLSKNKNLVIGIFSGGREDHQLQKIKVFEHVLHKEHIHIFKMKGKELPNLMKKYQQDNLFLVDDVLEILYNANQVNTKITTVWMKRGRIAAQQQAITGFTPDYIVENLREIIPVINQN